MAWYPGLLPFFPKKNVSKELLKIGYGEIYRQAGSQYGGLLKEFEKIENKARYDNLSYKTDLELKSTLAPVPPTKTIHTLASK